MPFWPSTPGLGANDEFTTNFTRQNGYIAYPVPLQRNRVSRSPEACIAHSLAPSTELRSLCYVTPSDGTEHALGLGPDAAADWKQESSEGAQVAAHAANTCRPCEGATKHFNHHLRPLDQKHDENPNTKGGLIRWLNRYASHS
eukprot:1291137-Pyramimonas_sp.AAC.1